MITVSYDPEAGTLYWYFTELVEGSTTGEGECDGALLLDQYGDVIGLELELDESINPGDLTFALSHPQVRYNKREYRLTILIADEEPAALQPLHEPVILDFDDDEHLQGCEVTTAEEFELGVRLGRLAPFMVDLEVQEEDGVPDEGATLATIGEALPDQAELDPTASSPAGFRSGFVALVGPPNVGKSTLLNSILGQKVAIVSPRPQTTRMAIRGILNRPEAQIIFVDTPGIHQPRTRLGTFMVEQARRAIPDSDVICMVVDITRPPGKLDQRIAEMVRRSRAPKLLVLNKIDLPNPQGQEYLAAYRALGPWDMELAVSARRGEGLETLLNEIMARLPADRPLYPTDQVTDQSQREHAAELVREQVLRYTEQEVPHGVAVEVEEWEERERAIYIRMTVYVEKDSQKGILIGSSGAMLKQIGSAARQNIEAALGQIVYLDLWVKTRANWRDDPNALHWLGYKNQR